MLNRGGVRPAMFRFGFTKVFCKDPSRSSILSIEGILNLYGDEVSFGSESSLTIRHGATLTFKGNFYNTSALNLDCHEYIELGKGMIVSWNTFIMDGDSHNILDLRAGKTKSSVKPIIIGDRVWMGMNSVILKGAQIGDGCIIAANAVVSGIHSKNLLLAGCPAKELNNNVVIGEDFTTASNMEQHGSKLKKWLRRIK